MAGSPSGGRPEPKANRIVVVDARVSNWNICGTTWLAEPVVLIRRETGSSGAFVAIASTASVYAPVDGREAGAAIARLFAQPAVAYLQAHYATRGCYAARIDRAARSAQVSMSFRV